MKGLDVSSVKEGITSIGDKAQYVISGSAWDDFKMNVLLWVVVAIVAIILICTLFDGVRRAIRGLDVAAIGGLFIWIGTKIPDVPLLNDLKAPALYLGLGLVVLGVIVFIIAKTVGRKRQKKKDAKKRSKLEDQIRQEVEGKLRAELKAAEKPAEPKAE